MKVERVDLLERTINYSLRLIKLYQELKRDEAGRILGKQLLRSGTSIGANLHEAQGGQSKADFISKISIAYKEARETLYWLLLIEKSSLFQGFVLGSLIDETEQLIKIFCSIILSSKQNLRSTAVHSSNS